MNVDIDMVHCLGLCTNTTCDHQEPDPRHVEDARAWLRVHCAPRKSINYRMGSYALKHLMPSYVTAGAFIQAALLEGYRAIPASSGNLNAFFNVRLQVDGAEVFRPAKLVLVCEGCH